MTNLVEKTLLIGFGILMIFTLFGIISPYITTFNMAKQNQNDFDSVFLNICQIDSGIRYISNNNNLSSNKNLKSDSNNSDFGIEKLYNGNIIPRHEFQVKIYGLNVDYVFLLDGLKKITKSYDIMLNSSTYTLFSNRIYGFSIYKSNYNETNLYSVNFKPIL
jgi:hypothetical protein